VAYPASLSAGACVLQTALASHKSPPVYPPAMYDYDSCGTAPPERKESFCLAPQRRSRSVDSSCARTYIPIPSTLSHALKVTGRQKLNGPLQLACTGSNRALVVIVMGMNIVLAVVFERHSRWFFFSHRSAAAMAARRRAVGDAPPA
jgi:hypothetical protein